MRLRYTMIFRMIGWLHTLAIYWCFYPLAVCFFWPEEPGMEAFCMTGILLLFPIILSWYAKQKMKHLILYLGAGLIVSFGYGTLNGILCAALGIDSHQGTLLAMILCLILFLTRGWKEPLPFHWIFFALHYVLGALYEVSFYWHMAFYLFLLDVFLCFMFRFFGGYSRFLQEHSQSANLPVKTMQKVIGIIFCFACMGLLMFALPSLLYGKAPLSSLSFEEQASSGEKMPKTNPEDNALTAMDMAVWEETSAREDSLPYEMPGWLVFLSTFFTYLLCAGGIFAVFLLIYRACKNAGNYFAAETEDEIYFLEKQRPALDGRMRKVFSRQIEDSANIHIRQIYKKILRRGMKALPEGSETPGELERKAGFTGDDKELLLHTSYEKARYSGVGCTEDEVTVLKRQMQGLKLADARKGTERLKYAVQREIVLDRKVSKNICRAEREKKAMKNQKNRLKIFGGDKIFNIFLLVFLSITCIVIVYPLYYVAVASVTDPVVVNSGKVLLYPERLNLNGYRAIFGQPLFWVPYKNTIIYTAVGTLISLASTIPAGYVLSRKELVGRKILNGLFIFTMFFSGGTIPLYLTVLKLGIYNTIWAMVLPTAVSVYNLLVCRSFFEAGLPEEVWEAARVDGCTYMIFFFKFVLPLSKTIMGVMALLYATAQWNQYWNAIIYLRDEEKMPLQVQLAHMARSELKYCTVVVIAFPFLLAYPFFQKYFVQGVTIRSAKK